MSSSSRGGAAGGGGGWGSGGTAASISSTAAFTSASSISTSHPHSEEPMSSSAAVSSAEFHPPHLNHHLAYGGAGDMGSASGPFRGPAGLMSKGIISLEEGFAYLNEHGIRPFLQMVQTNQPGGWKAGQFVKLYDLIFSMCVQKEPHNWSGELYDRYSHVIVNYYLQNLRPSLRLAVRQIDDTVLLRAWNEAWRQHTLIEKGLSQLFMYLDRFFAPNNSDSVLPLSAQAHAIFYDIVFKDSVEAITQAVLRCMQRERQGEEQDRELLRTAVQVYVEMGTLLFRSGSGSQANSGGRGTLAPPAGRQPAGAEASGPGDLSAVGGNSGVVDPKNPHHRLELYRQLLEAPVVQETSQWYEINSRVWLEQDTCPAYLAKVELNVKLEIDRVKAFLHPSSIAPVTNQIYKHTLKHKRDELLQKPTGLVHMLQNCDSAQSQEDLSRLYRLYNLWNDVGGIADAFCKQVTAEGTKIVEDSADSKPPTSESASEASSSDPGSAGGAADQPQPPDSFTLVRRLVILHARYHELVCDSFRSAQPFHVALTKAFEHFVNLDGRVTKQLARFIHEVLKKGSRVQPINSPEATMHHVVALYGYIRDKDIFERSYQQHLASRLLNNECESEHTEKLLIAMFKSQCGYQWTYQLEGMFKDMQLSLDLLAQFGQATNQAALDNVQLQMKVCTPGCWPYVQNGDRDIEADEGCLTTTPKTAKLPDVLAPVWTEFKEFYLKRHRGRELDFCLAKGTAEVKVTFSPQTTKTLVCTTYQMIILLAFNGYRYVTLPQLLSITGLPVEEIADHLISMCHPKVNILLKRPAGAQLDDQCKFMINARYNNPLLKVVVPLLHLKTKAAPSATSKSVQVQRRCMVDAAIVRILKTRREIRHNLLVAEVIQQLQARFEVKTSFVKERLEALMDDYLERSPDDRSVYLYKM